MDLIRHFEGFADKGLPDAFKRVGDKIVRDWDAPDAAVRGGWGSDTITDPSTGIVRKVTRGMPITMEEANADLRRRTSEEFLPRVMNEIGRGTFSDLSTDKKSALGSMAYHYGSVPDSVAELVKSGDHLAVAKEIKRLGEGQVYANRNMVTSAIYLKGTKIQASNEEEARDILADLYDTTDEGLAKIGIGISKDKEGNYAVRTLGVQVKTTKDGGDGSDDKEKDKDKDKDQDKEDGTQPEDGGRRGGIISNILGGGGGGGVFSDTVLNRESRENMTPGTGIAQLLNLHFSPKSFFLHKTFETLVKRFLGDSTASKIIQEGMNYWFAANHWKDLGDMLAGDKSYGEHLFNFPFKRHAYACKRACKRCLRTRSSGYKRRGCHKQIRRNIRGLDRRERSYLNDGRLLYRT